MSLNRLKVLILPSWLPSRENPILGVFVLDQARALQTVHDVAILWPEVTPFRSLLRVRPRPAEGEAGPDGVLLMRCRARARVPHSRLAVLHARRRAALRGLQRLVATWGRPEVIHAHVVLPAGWIALALGKELGAPVVLTEHSSPFAARLRRRWERPLVASTLRRCDVVIAVGPGLAAEMRRAGFTGRIEVIGNVVATPRSVERHPAVVARAGCVSIAFVGGLVEQKGAGDLLVALARLHHDGFGFHAYLAGDGPLRAALEARAEELAIASRCTFLGTLPRAEVQSLVASCELLVAPSLHESFCLATAEALALGKPVVTTRCGGPEHYVTPDRGAVVEPRDAEALAAAIREVAGSLDRFDSGAIRASVLERFGSGAFVESMTAVYGRVIATHAAPAPAGGVGGEG